jgi:hypothetical protein
MLDVGGSHGLYTVEFCEEYPGLEGTIVDWPIGLEAARRTLDERPAMADRIDPLERDRQAEELPEGYDFAFLGQIVHGLTAEGNQALFEKLSRATTERGTVAILGQVADPPSTSRLPFDPLNDGFPPTSKTGSGSDETTTTTRVTTRETISRPRSVFSTRGRT